LERSGQLLSKFLAGCWRRTPPAFEATPAELEQIAPRLEDPHIAALAWQRIQGTGLQSLPAAQRLLELSRRSVLRNKMALTQMGAVLSILRESGIEPILIKGWSSARLYARPELRGYGDVDLLIRPSQLEHARALLSGRTDVDLDHYEFLMFSGAALEDVFARSELVSAGGFPVRVLGPEDHLSLLCRHFGRHLAAYPFGLCDVAAALEVLPENFDWDRCLGTDPRAARWTECTLKLAHDLLGARLERPVRIPGWLASGVLRQWDNEPSKIESINATPDGMWGGVKERWPSPLAAMLLLGRPVSNAPRLPYQVFWFTRLAWRFVQRAT
jgi:hypothetical protein